MDELAHAAGADPLMMRLELIEHAPSRAVLESVAEMSNWGSKLPPGHARGVAYALSSGAATAQVIEISHFNAEIKLHKVYAAVDVGIALDPGIIEAQVQGSLIFGLSAAINGEITVTDSVVDQTNFHTYPLLRMDQSPPIDVRIHESREKILGVGESATPTTAPALGNAIFAATGQRIRELPFGKVFRFV
jgi:isoquinoline 1-oxidoreductase beta subunit